jgi:hypothetical protein
MSARAVFFTAASYHVEPGARSRRDTVCSAREEERARSFIRQMTRSPTVASLLVLTLGCSTTATIQRTNGPDNEATIEYSDGDTLYVRGSNGQLYSLPRDTVADIDHPGNVALTVGAILATLAAVTIVSSRAEDRKDVTPFVAAIYGAPAVALMASGGYCYLRSKDASAKFHRGDDSVLPAPGYVRVPAFEPTPLPPPPPLPAPRPAAEPAPPSPDGGTGLD